MAIPDYQTIMLPLLKFLEDSQEQKVRDATNHISNHFKLSDDEKHELLESGAQTIIHNRVGWARTYLVKAGLLESSKRGYIRITDRGIEVLNKKPETINVKYLNQFSEFVEFRTLKKDKKKKANKDEVDIEVQTPDELIEKGYSIIKADLAKELLTKLRDVDPFYFEQIVGKLLSAMGYGKSEITKRSGDQGIDGIVSQDKLGIDKIFFQAKRYDENNIVGARDVRDFVGTLELNGVSKGIFITTSKFPKDTLSIIEKTPKNIILIDGLKLADLMIEHGVGVSTEKIYRIKKIDSDFFIED